MPGGMSILAWVFGLLTASSVGYYIAVILAGLRFRANAACADLSGPPAPVSILKPIQGADPHLAANLDSHANLEYPRFEIVFGLADAADPALAEIESLRRRQPEIPIQVHICGVSSRGNAKVAILEELAAQAEHELLLVNDADIRLRPSDLRRLAAELTRETGLVTTLYCARPGCSAASRLDAAWINGDFPGQVLTGAYWAGLSIALGASMLLRKADLDRIGGFEAIRPYLADDYELGRRIAALGKPIRLSGVVVETVLGAPSWSEVWQRHLRWSRTIRASRPSGHAGFGITFGIVWGLVLVMAGGPIWPLGCVVAGRIVASACSASAVGAGYAAALMAPCVELWSAAVWVWSFASRQVDWRGRRLRLDAVGRIGQRLG